jgi:hypothetical protein
VDRVTDVTPEFASGIGLALLTIFFAVPPLAFLGMYLASRIDRSAPTSAPPAAPTSAPLPFPDALHAFARFALVLIAVHACVVLPFTSFVTLAVSGNWPLALFLLVLLVILGTVDANGLRAWTHVFRHAAQARPASLANTAAP